MNIDWKIKEKYPKAYSKFIKDNNYVEVKISTGVEFVAKNYNLDFGYYELLCYCDIEKFFDDNGIKIHIEPFPLFHNDTLYRYEYEILRRGFTTITSDLNFNTRQEAQVQAIYKAFEIMEGLL
jgi:hypothetical protein